MKAYTTTQVQRTIALKAAQRDLTSPAWEHTLPEVIDVHENQNGTWSMYVNHLDLDYGNGLRKSKWYRIQSNFAWVR